MFDLNTTGTIKATTKTNKCDYSADVKLNSKTVNIILTMPNKSHITRTVSNTASKQIYIAHTISNIILSIVTGINGIFNSKIAFIVQDGMMFKIIIADYDGNNQHVIVKSNRTMSSIVWSKDNKQVAYVSYAKKKPIVYVQNLHTGKKIYCG